jgi:integrase
VISDRQTVSQYLQTWLETIRPTIEYSTWNRHREYVELHIVPKIGLVRLRELALQQVQELYADRLCAGLSSSTVHHLHATLHKALKDAERVGLVARKVCKLVSVPRMDETEIHPLSRAEARILLHTIFETRMEAFYVVVLATGTRLSEFLGLRWADLDFDAQPMGILRVRTQLKRVQGAWVWKEPKTKRSRRQAALSPYVVDMLRRHRSRQDAERLHQRANREVNDLVFCTHTGKPLMSRNVYRHFMGVLDKAKSPRIRIHDLRHTAATLLLSARVNPKVVSEMLGHASVAITLDIYSHVLPDIQHDAAAAMVKQLHGYEDVRAKTA